MEEVKTRAYEMAFLLRNEEDMEVIMRNLSSRGAEIVKEGGISRIRLSYPIRKENEAYFGYVHFNMVPSSVVELEAALRLESKVARFLIVTPPFANMSTRRFEQRPSGAEAPSQKKEQEEVTNHSNEISNAALEEKLEEILK